MDAATWETLELVLVATNRSVSVGDGVVDGRRHASAGRGGFVEVVVVVGRGARVAGE